MLDDDRLYLNHLYLNEVGRLSLAEDQDGDSVADAVTPLLQGLPSSVHSASGIVVAPSGPVLMALGSTCNDCRESNALAASVLAFEPDSGDLKVYASGLRNARGLAFDADGRAGPPTPAPLRPVRVRTNSTRSVPRSTTAGPTAQTKRPRFASQVGRCCRLASTQARPA